MNCVRELRIKKGVQQKELAISLGVSQAAISDWENGKKNPKGENLKKLAEYFNVDEQFIIGYGMENPESFIPENPKISGVSETEQIVQHVLDKLGAVPKTIEARMISTGIDSLPKEKREQALAVYIAMFPEHKNDFKERTTDNET